MYHTFEFFNIMSLWLRCLWYNFYYIRFVLLFGWWSFSNCLNATLSWLKSFIISCLCPLLFLSSCRRPFHNIAWSIEFISRNPQDPSPNLCLRYLVDDYSMLLHLHHLVVWHYRTQQVAVPCCQLYTLSNTSSILSMGLSCPWYMTNLAADPVSERRIANSFCPLVFTS